MNYEINKQYYSGERLTLGEFRKITAEFPEDLVLIINCPCSIDDDGTVFDREARDVGELTTYWHGALTFTEK